MRIGGFLPFTTTDYPGQLACVVFTQGCPLRCKGCYNSHLQPIDIDTPHRLGHVYNFLKSRQGKLDAVVFSGGEPLYQRDLPACMAACRDLGYKVGLHTSGYHAGRLWAVLQHVDWVGIDFKAAPHAYLERVGIGFERVEASLLLLRESGKPFEVRTTLTPEVEADFGRELQHISRVLTELDIKHLWKHQPYYEVDERGNLRHPCGGEDSMRGVDPSDGLPPSCGQL